MAQLEHSLLGDEGGAEGPVAPLEGYRELSLLGRGGAGLVVLAVEEATGREVALKRLHRRTALHLDALLREASAIARLRHPAVVRLERVVERGDDVVLVLEHVPGPDLATLVAREGPLAPERVARVVRDVAGALAAAHSAGLIHRDVKPSNVLLTPAGGAKLTDFGLALTLDLDSLSGDEASGPVGTVEYMAPEQWHSPGEVDPSADVFGVGATLYFLLTGQSPRVVRPERVPEPWRELVLRCLEERPQDRPPSAEALLAELTRVERAAKRLPWRRVIEACFWVALLAWIAWGFARRVFADPSPPGAADREGWRARLRAATTEEERTACVRAGAEAGDPAAMNLLGFRLLTGAGCARDPEAAFRWGERAARLGHAEAMFGIAGLLERGEGVARDPAAAARWYRRAIEAGDTLAGPALEGLLREHPHLRER